MQMKINIDIYKEYIERYGLIDLSCYVKLDKTIIQPPPGYRRRRRYLAVYGWMDGWMDG